MLKFTMTIQSFEAAAGAAIDPIAARGVRPRTQTRRFGLDGFALVSMLFFFLLCSFLSFFC